MSTLYVTEQNAWIRKTSDRLVIEKDGELLAEVPCLKLETVFLYGNVQFTTQALAELLDHGIEVALFTMSGSLRGQLTPPKAKNVVLRMKQYELAGSEERCLSLAKEVVGAKVAGSMDLLRDFRRNHPEAFSPAEVAAIEAQAQRVAEARTLEELRGLEGVCAAKHFELLVRIVPPELGFVARRRRPPPDPFNALLSFGYVIVGNELQSLLDGMGFDPYLGFFHQVEYGRPSLALDLLEEFRAPLVDRMSLKLINLRVVSQADFVSDAGGGVLLNQEGKRRYFRFYEQELTREVATTEGSASFRQIFRRQAERLARALRGEETYRSFRP